MELVSKAGAAPAIHVCVQGTLISDDNIATTCHGCQMACQDTVAQSRPSPPAPASIHHACSLHRFSGPSAWPGPCHHLLSWPWRLVERLQLELRLGEMRALAS